MNYITEARRLGVPLPSRFPVDGDRLRYAMSTRSDGLCIEGCAPCRDLRFAVREAQEAEAAEFREKRAAVAASEEALLAWVTEEAHTQEAIEEVMNHLNLLPESDLLSIVRDGLAATIGATRLAFRENYAKQDAAHAQLVAGIGTGATLPGEGADPIADLLALFSAPGATVSFEPVEDETFEARQP